MRQPSPKILAQMGLLLGATLIAVGCGGSSSSNPCSSLNGMTIPAASIGLATNGATVSSATLVPAASATSGVEHCLVVGAIQPYTTGGLPINFKVALPTTWNHKTYQIGGGGFDGTIPAVDTATAAGITAPLARGYATLASDSGHIAPYLPGGTPPFAWNDETRLNFGRQQVKKTHDAAMAIIQARYASSPQHNYFQGGSQGGHEALIAAQFYPEDFDGVVVGFPAYNLESMHPGSIDYAKTLYNARTSGSNGFGYTTPAGGGWISRAQMAYVSTQIMGVCDALDGATDGIVSNPGDPTCKAYRDNLYLHSTSNPLRCAGGAHAAALGTAEYDADTCLSDPQIETLARITSRYNFTPGVTLEGGLKSYGKWPMLDGIWFAKDATKDSSQEDFGSAYNVIDAFQSTFPCLDQVGMLTQQPGWTSATILSDFNIADWRDKLMTVSSQVDTSSVDYSVFRGRGGKMIHYHGASDVSITPYNSIDLYLRMTGQFVDNTQYLGTNTFWGSSDAATNATVGQNSNVAVYGGIVEDFYSFYLIPGLGHGHGYFQASVDWLTALEKWVEKDLAPRNTLVATDTSTAHTSLGTRPVCYFPYYPKFTGTVSSDITLAANYSCTPLDAYTNLKDVYPVPVED